MTSGGGGLQKWINAPPIYFEPESNFMARAQFLTWVWFGLVMYFEYMTKAWFPYDL